MRPILLFASVALSAAAAIACGSSAQSHVSGSGPSGDGGGGGGGGGGSATSSPTAADAGAAGDDGGGPGADIPPPNTTGVGAGTGAVTGFPCDVQQLLENRCIGCHAGGSLPPLLTYGDLTAPSPADPTKSMAQASLARMESTTSPMPPAPAVPPTAAEVGVLSAWIAAGTPRGAACTPAPDGGAGGGGAVADGGVPSTPVVCTSNTYSKGGEGPAMSPGQPCQTCHQQRGGPAFDVAGTVYPTAHEPNNCNGKGPPPALTIVVTDSKGKVTNVPVNSVGNFFTGAKVAPPFHVAVTDGTRTRAMATALTAGDCNSCHTEAGANGAPGRVMAP